MKNKFITFGTDSSGSDTFYGYWANDIKGMYPTSDTNLRIHVTGDHVAASQPDTDNIYINITITSNKHKEVMEAIYKEINFGEDPVILIADNINGVYLDSNMSDVSISVSQSAGFNIVGYAGYFGSTYIHPNDWIAEEGTTDALVIETGVTGKLGVRATGSTNLYACVRVPQGFTANGGRVDASDNSLAVEFYKGEQDGDLTSLGTTTSNNNVTLASTFASQAGEFMWVRIAVGSTNTIFGGRVTWTQTPR
jgi:hypothetical protein|tara:strand:- start:4926 stop:5678 length:753 start_codon:yes stop_codon:yes gene_type:complete